MGRGTVDWGRAKRTVWFLSLIRRPSPISWISNLGKKPFIIISGTSRLFMESFLLWFETSHMRLTIPELILNRGPNGRTKEKSPGEIWKGGEEFNLRIISQKALAVIPRDGNIAGRNKETVLIHVPGHLPPKPTSTYNTRGLQVSAIIYVVQQGNNKSSKKGIFSLPPSYFIFWPEMLTGLTYEQRTEGRKMAGERVRRKCFFSPRHE